MDLPRTIINKLVIFLFKEQIEKLIECNIYLMNLHVRSFTKERYRQMQLSVQFWIFHNRQQSRGIWNDSTERHMLQFPCVFLPNPTGKERRVEADVSVNVNPAMQIKTFVFKARGHSEM